jgi:small-conductance mechanosensitive channel
MLPGYSPVDSGFSQTLVDTGVFDAVAELLGGLPLWQAAVILLVTAALLSVAVERVGLELLRRLVRKTESEVDDIIFEELRLPVVTTVFLAGVFTLTQLPAAATVLGNTAVEQFIGRPSITVVVLVWARALNRSVNRGVEAIQSSGRNYEFAPVISNVWTLFVIVASAFLLLTTWNINITPLLGAAGVAGIAIGFAAKDTVANFFGGLALYFDDTYKLGDFVVLDSGESGTVVKVGIRSTTLLTRSEVLITVPNSMLNAGKVINESAPQRRKRIKLPLGVGYDTELDTFEEAALAVAAEEPLVLERPQPRMRFRAFGDSALEYDLLCWVASPTVEGKTRHRLNRGLFTAMREAGVEIPFPKRDVTLLNADGGPFEQTAVAGNGRVAEGEGDGLGTEAAGSGTDPAGDGPVPAETD